MVAARAYAAFFCGLSGICLNLASKFAKNVIGAENTPDSGIYTAEGILREHNLNLLAKIRRRQKPWARRVLGLFVMVWLNVALQPCAMALGDAHDIWH